MKKKGGQPKENRGEKYRVRDRIQLTFVTAKASEEKEIR